MPTHPHWPALLKWLEIDTDKIFVEPRSVTGAGYGLFALAKFDPSVPLFTIPAKALLNSLTLEPLYPGSGKLSCTQIITLHLSLNRPVNGFSKDPHFGPYIAVLPENFDDHPFTWFWKSMHLRQSCSDLELGLLKNLPSRVTAKLERMLSLCEKDKIAVETYMGSHPTLNTAPQDPSFLDNFLWAWLNVNTRCIYHRIRKSRADPDNMTLCPILDFANHAIDTPTAYPQPTRGEIWNIGPSAKRKFGEDFTLLAPSQRATHKNDELYLKYGAHSNSTLFTEYGFVLAGGDNEVELVGIVEDLFEKRGKTGDWMKEALISEGYWGDWTLHAHPEPAHPSYRLITALRLYHCVSGEGDLPHDKDHRLQQWRDVTYGISSAISNENERLWRNTLLQLCQTMVGHAQKGIDSIRSLREQHAAHLHDAAKYAQAACSFIETLWEEEMEMGCAVTQSLEDGVEF